MLNKVKGVLLKDPIVSLNVITYLILFIIPFSPIWWFWPYPLYLAVLDPQLFGSSPFRTTFTDVATLCFYIIVWTFGLWVAFLIGKHVSKKNRKKNKSWYTYWWTPLVWFGILLLIEAVIFLFVRIGLGIPVGE
jgi:hypothetical protein